MNIKILGLVEGISEAACDKHTQKSMSMWLHESSQYKQLCDCHTDQDTASVAFQKVPSSLQPVNLHSLPNGDSYPDFR